MQIIREEKKEIKEIEVYDSLEEFTKDLRVCGGRYLLPDVEKFEKKTIQGVDLRTKFVTMYTSSSRIISSAREVYITEGLYQALLDLSSPIYTLADEIYDEDAEEIYIKPANSIEEAQELLMEACSE